MGISTCNKHQVNAIAMQLFIQLPDTRTNVASLIVVEARHEMRRASHHFNAVCDGHPGNCEGLPIILRSVINAGQDMAMQINQIPVSLGISRILDAVKRTTAKRQVWQATQNLPI
jgi:hypothetical protein